ncbi:MAG: exo-alpha-sialidase [Chloroflexi bacterium]|nr:exo-alpha-sialidase [Chloroflexota bacterium]
MLRSYDRGATWDVANATQIAAGGGGGAAMLYRGAGRVVGALPKHSVAPRHEAERAGLPPHPHEYPFRLEGTYWIWSDNWGLTWPLANCNLVSRTAMSCGEPYPLPDDTILLPTYGTNARAAVWSALLYRSTDDTHIAPEPAIMALGTPETREYYEPALVETEPGRLYALHRVGQVAAGAGNTFWANESFDGGATWTEPVDTGIVSGACPRLFKLADGRLLLTYGRRQAPFALRALLSADGGRSWGDSAYILREAPNWDQGYTSTVELGGGRVLTVSYMQNDASVTGIVGTFWTLP